jgi:eukaryotic-like serine/threonine-protein kinase
MRNGAAPNSEGVAPEEVRACVERILRDERFVRSQALSRFLRYSVEETLEGRGDTLKESVLGMEVFRRGKDFDQRLDPIVRIQAGKLRTRLAEYYRTEGSAEGILIEYRRGGYTPVFRRRGQANAEAAAAVSGASAPAGRRVRWAAGMALVASAVCAAWFLLPLRKSAQPAVLVERLTSDTGVSIFPAISRDGRVLVYSSDRAGAGDLDLWARFLSGGEPVRLTRAAGSDITPDLSPDGERVVFRSNRAASGLYTVRLPGGEEMRLSGSGWRPRFSPDGKRIVYQDTGSRPGGGIWIMSAAGGGARPVEIRNRVRLGGGPVWTPDGKYILFAGFDEDRADWWLIEPEGGEAVSTGLAARLPAQGLGHLDMESLPGDFVGREVVFPLVRGTAANLWLAPLCPGEWKVCGDVRQLTSGSDMELSPRGSGTGRVVFSGDKLLTRIWSVAEGSEMADPLTRDASIPPGHFRTPARFSASRRRLAYASQRSGNPDIYLRDLQSGTEEMLAGSPAAEEHPLFSPDGKKVAYMTTSGGRKDLHVIDVESRLSRRVCEGCGEPFGWLPDNCGVLYGAARGRVTGLAVVNVCSGGVREWLSREDLSVRHSTVSPDGRWAAVVTAATASGVVALYLVALERGAPAAGSRWVFSPSAEPEGPVLFAPGGERVYYLASADGFRCLWTQSFDSATAALGEPRAVRHFHDSRLAPWNSWLWLAEGRFILSLTESSSNVWSLRVKN